MYPGVIDKNKGVEDPRAAVWADTAATSNFRKLYGILTKQTLKAGSTLNFNITNRFSLPFGVTKGIVLSTTSFLGGKQNICGIFYVIYGFVCMGIALVFCFKKTNIVMDLSSKESIHGTYYLLYISPISILLFNSKSYNFSYFFTSVKTAST